MCTACALVGCQSFVSAGCKECFAQRLLAGFQMNFGRVELAHFCQRKDTTFACFPISHER